jgi:hypothetical protein
MPVVPLEASVVFTNSARPRGEAQNHSLLVIIRIPLGEIHSMFERIVIEAEPSGDFSRLFRLQLDGHLIGQGLTVGQVQLLLREVLDRINPPHPHARTAAGLA